MPRFTLSPCHLVTLSPCHLVTLSPCHPDIKSPTPGTFYARPNPEAEPYVKVGSRVEPKTVVCTIEAMKLYTEIQAECSGVIQEILVENGQFVEFDTVLFRVDPTA